MDFKLKVGERIKELRKEKNLSQQKIALAADMERSFMTHIESGRRNISLETLEKIINALEVTIPDFFNSKLFVNGK